jgi:cobalt/nickel transport system permease protein
MLPDWMAGEPAAGAVESGSSRKSNSYLSKSIRHMNRVILDALATERFASQPGLMQRLDPRVRLLSVFALVLLAGLTRSMAVLIGLLAITLILTSASKLPLWTLQKRVWGFIPLLTLLISIPGVFNVIVDGTPLLQVHHFAQPLKLFGVFDIPQDIFITRQGCRAAFFLVMRVGISVSLGTLLAVTTPAARLLKSLQVLRLPPLLVMTIEMSYRYLVLMLMISIEMFEARSLRTVGTLSLQQKREMVGSSIGALFGRSMALVDEVYMAMSARCYTGQAVTEEPLKIGRLDMAWMALLLIVLLTTVAGEWFIV